MKFFADSASIEEIAFCFSREVDDGITTNPKIMVLTGDLSLGFEAACKFLIEKYSNVPISLETTFDGLSVYDTDSMPRKTSNILLKQANELSSWGSNVVVKIPICKGGLMATEILSKNGIKTNVTGCMTPYQALEAANAGATYVSLFANRMLDFHILELSGNNLKKILTNPDWKNIVKENKEKYSEEAWKRTLGQIAYVAKNLEGKKSQLIVGSIRSPEDIYKIASAEPHVITIPTKIVKGLENIPSLKNTKRSFRAKDVIVGESILHPMTLYTLDEFERAAEIYRNK